MKRPIAEVRTMAVQPGKEAEWLRDEQEMWQILRRKQGYVTHHLYGAVGEPEGRLVYSEWESKKALDGARQLMQGTPLARRARATLAAAPERVVGELVAPVTSTKGLDLPETAIAVMAMARVQPGSGTADHSRLGKALASLPGHITHVVMRGLDDPDLVGALSHWQDAGAVDQALAQLRDGGDTGLASPLTFAQYRLLGER